MRTENEKSITYRDQLVEWLWPNTVKRATLRRQFYYLCHEMVSMIRQVVEAKPIESSAHSFVPASTHLLYQWSYVINPLLLDLHSGSMNLAFLAIPILSRPNHCLNKHVNFNYLAPYSCIISQRSFRLDSLRLYWPVDPNISRWYLVRHHFYHPTNSMPCEPLCLPYRPPSNSKRSNSVRYCPQTIIFILHSV